MFAPNSPMPEEYFFFESSCGRLFSALHNPECEAKAGLVFCAPFADEQRASYRNLIEFGRDASERGYATLRFDYLGTGDSEGDFSRFSLSSAKQQILEELLLLRQRLADKPLGALGLRLGANLALSLAEELDFLILWQPIPDGTTFYQESLRRQRLRKALIGASSRPSTHEGIIDLDGFPLRQETVEELEAVRLPEEPPGPPTLLVQISHTSQPLPQLMSISEKLGENFRTVRLKPFWLRIGFVDTSELNELTLDWLDNLGASYGVTS